MPTIEWASMMSSVSTLQLSRYSRRVRKVLVDNHKDDYEVEASDTGKDLLSLTVIGCVTVTVHASQCALCSQSSSEFRPSRYMLDRNVDRAL